MEYYADAIEAYGHRVVGRAEDGLAAVELYKNLSEKPDLVIMDHRLPLQTGLEAAREIMAFDQSAKVIFATADMSVEREALAAGAIGFEKKPFPLSRLIENIESA